LLAAFTATSVLTREIENRTVVTVVSKPVPRPAVILGKYLGVAAALAIGFWSLAAVFLLAVRHRVAIGGPMDSAFDGPVVMFGTVATLAAVFIAAAANYLRGRSFSSTFVFSLAVTATLALACAWSLDKSWRPQDPLGEWNPQLMLAVALVFEAILVLAAVAIAASTRLGQTMTLLACVGVFLAGLVGEYFLGTIVAGDQQGPAWARWVAWPAYAALPNMQFFWQADALTQGQAITLAHCGAVTLYAAAMILAFLSLAVILFQDRDVG
jgi:ABC-type transport system involved in multi-copper enzyme maturation permease subunit